ncbi:MAG: hypothetical protein RL091_1105 [Verrucomicrobiota bacterium]
MKRGSAQRRGVSVQIRNGTYPTARGNSCHSNLPRLVSLIKYCTCRPTSVPCFMPAPSPLPENTGLAFLGEAAWPAALLTERAAEKLLATANRCGRPNADVLRRRLAVLDGEPVEQWQIDFPTHFTSQEAALYEQPFAMLQQRGAGALPAPGANPELRRALARLTRYLALPAAATTPDWRWIEDDLLPDATLLVVARDDDFTHGVLSSRAFGLWWHAHCAQLGPVATVAAFPFPWPPATALSVLTKAQEEQRHAIARAARSGNEEQLNSAVSAAYGWATESDVSELLGNLTALNGRRGQ